MRQTSNLRFTPSAYLPRSAVASLASSVALLDAWPETEADSQLPPDLRRIFLLAALLLPVKAVTYKEKKSMQPASKFVIREGLKLPAKDADRVRAGTWILRQKTLLHMSFFNHL